MRVEVTYEQRIALNRLFRIERLKGPFPNKIFKHGQRVQVRPNLFGSVMGYQGGREVSIYVSPKDNNGRFAIYAVPELVLWYKQL